jgi:ubiquinone/menaquinone biosynthesis C-methylase UbiE
MIELVLPQAVIAPVTIEVQKFDAHNFLFENETFDAVTSSLIFCSIPDQPRALAEITQVFNPGGELCLLKHPWSHQ